MISRLLIKLNLLICFSLIISCSQNDTDINKIKESVYIPSTYKFIDFRKYEDFLTDGLSEMIFVFEINGEEYEKFIKNNKLIKFKKSYRWADNYNEDFDFYPYNIKQELNLPNCKDLDKFYYNHWDDIDASASVECFFDSNIGLVVISYEF